MKKILCKIKNCPSELLNSYKQKNNNTFPMRSSSKSKKIKQVNIQTNQN